MVADLGYTAIEVADGPSELQVLHSHTRIDLLVGDGGPPDGINGRQMPDAARVSRPDLKVLFITGDAENAVVGDWHLGPGMHVMTKPSCFRRHCQPHSGVDRRAMKHEPLSRAPSMSWVREQPQPDALFDGFNAGRADKPRTAHPS
ncbi:hypothetical protein ACFOD4_02000 [Pseudoroseomonas globiformis]|uniref:Response regulatory domain-containing protein n=1 Tax=Teichococcus globiformis TaxID=2307229 RepID=A0ABV7FYH5_9PROT